MHDMATRRLSFVHALGQCADSHPHTEQSCTAVMKPSLMQARAAVPPTCCAHHALCLCDERHRRIESVMVCRPCVRSSVRVVALR